MPELGDEFVCSECSEPLVIGADNQQPIAPTARDRVLLLKNWPDNLTPETIGEPGWELSPEGIPLRHMHILNEMLVPAAPNVVRKLEPVQHYWEALLRFPNAPVYATHRARVPSYIIGEKETWPNYHTMRMLGAGREPCEQIKHVYLLHNGLNETRDFLFHYRLAAWILNGRSDAVCIIRPLPGHLTRFPFHGAFSETPLDNYLRDPMELFRQFLRYMIETQWLLSAIVPRDYYAVVAGGRLLSGKAHDPTEPDADDHRLLAETITDEWMAFFQSSGKRAGDARRERYSRIPVEADDMQRVVTNLRSLLKWEPVAHDRPPTFLPEDDLNAQSAEYPYVHTVGYSMGGFMAQAAFFSWPQVIASCTNLFAGGALRDLAPTAFAHPEEWQAVLHALRYDFDGALADGLLSGKGDSRVAGLDANDFGYMKRIFYEVFLQYYKGGYSSRVAEFSRRLLFIVGGDDPIVRTENLIDAGPPEGMTLLQLADVTHFPSGASWKAKDQQQVEKEQRIFWLPEIGRIIARFSERAAINLNNVLARCWHNGNSNIDKQLTKTSADVNASNHKCDLENSAFERELDALLEVVSKRGWLLVSRNELPPVFLGRNGFQIHARALHHSEELIYNYSQSLQVRANQLEELADRMTLLIPDPDQGWFQDEVARRKLFAKSETPGAAHMPSEADQEDMWRYFRERWCVTGAVRAVTASEYDSKAIMAGKLSRIGQLEAKHLDTDRLSLTMLPDIWIGLSPQLCSNLRGQGNPNDRIHNETVILNWVTELATKSDKQATGRLKRALLSGRLVALKVSAAELNPRYRGQRVTDPDIVSRALRHWALCYCASKLLDVGPTDDTTQQESDVSEQTTARN